MVVVCLQMEMEVEPGPELLGQLLPLLSGLSVSERLRVRPPSSPSQSQDRGGNASSYRFVGGYTP